MESAQPPSQFEQIPTPPRPKFGLIILLVVAGIAVASYFVVAKFLDLYPFEVSIPISTVTPRSTSNNHLVGWQTYKNDKYGFGFRYPVNWAQYNFDQNDSDAETFIPSNYVQRCFSASNSEYSCVSFGVLTAKERFQKHYDASRGGTTTLDVEGLPEKKFGTNIFKILEIGEGGAKGTNYLIRGNNGKYYGITYNAVYTDLSSELETIEQILSTFKFVPPSDINVGWQTYKNDKYGISLKYPQNWEVLNNDPGENVLDLSVRDKKYDGSFEWPGFSVSNSDTADLFTNAPLSVTFNFKPDNGLIRIKINNNEKILYATCALYNDSSVLSICNQILSTLK